MRRFTCTHCRRVRRQDTSTLAEPRARLTRSAVQWGLRVLALECMSVSRVAAALGISWRTANNAILTRAEQAITGNPHRFDGVEVLGGDEHVWRRTKRGDRYVTVLIDLAPCAIAVVRPGFWTWPRVVPRRSSRPGSSSATRTGTGGLRW